MKRVFLTSLIILILNDTVSAQFSFKKLKESVSKSDKLKELVDKAKPKSIFDKNERLKSFREEQLKKDTTYYNYIFSQGNRASFFANRKSKESPLLTFAKNYEDEEVEMVELEVYEKIFDLNHSAEYSIYLNPDVAKVSFLEAAALFTDSESFVSLSLNAPFQIEQMTDLDTMSLPEKYAVGKTVANISILIHAEGKYDLSEGFINETINYFQHTIGHGSVAMASLYNNAAVIAQSQGKYTKAEEYFTKSEHVLKSRDQENSLSHAILKSNLALFYNELGQYEKAKLSIEQALEMAQGELRENGRDNVSFKINQGQIYASAGDYAQAESVFNQVLELKRKRMARNQTDYANVENYLASVLMESGKVDQVPELLEDALRIFESKYNTQHPAYIKTRHNLGKYHLYTGNYDRAQEIIKEVNDAYKEYFGLYHPSYLNSLEDLAIISWKKGSYEDATSQFEEVISSNLELVERNFGAMSEYEKAQYWAKIRPSLLKFYSYVKDRHLEDPALLTAMYNAHLKTKGVLMSASTKIREQILNSENERLKTLYLDWKAAKEELLVYYSYSKSQLQESGISLSEKETKANALEKQLSRLSADFAESNKLPTTTMQDVKSVLQKGEAAIEIIGFPSFENSFIKEKNYACLIVTIEDQYPKMVNLENGKDLDNKYAKAYRNMIRLKVDDEITYSKFWQPIDNLLAGMDKAHVSLDGVFHQINIGALKRPDGAFVSDRLNILLHSSTRDLVKEKKMAQKNKKADFFGFPSYGNAGLLDALPGTEAEVNTISQMTKSNGFLTTKYTEYQASEENFKSLSSPNILHVATHGFFLQSDQSSSEKIFGIEVSQAMDNPLLRSGLMLANAEKVMGSAGLEAVEANSTNNGILTAYEVLTLDLEDTEMVVLSACETGLGEIKSGEGVYGLQRAFQLAGAESVIMSLWKVSDAATSQLMTNFYAEWLAGSTKEQAFFSAQKQLRIDFPEPYYWGAFVLLN